MRHLVDSIAFFLVALAVLAGVHGTWYAIQWTRIRNEADRRRHDERERTAEALKRAA